jgi:hypothetical protein
MHMHVGAVAALTVFAYVLILGFLWRTLASTLSDSPIGQAMAYIY